MGKRINAICSLLNPEDKFIDIGCDHAYVPIHLAKKGAKKILASDIHPKALEIAKKNIQEAGFEKCIAVQESDGLKKIDTKEYDTLVITGMGTKTIMQILQEKAKLRSIKKMILSSHQDLYELRYFMSKLGYALQKEIAVCEKGHDYIIMLYQKRKQKLSQKELELGIFDKEKKEYYKNLIAHHEQILKQLPNRYWKSKWEKRRIIRWLKKWIRKSETTKRKQGDY